MSPWLGLLFALFTTGATALLIGMLTLRLGNHYLPISNIAWGLSVPLVPRLEERACAVLTPTGK